MGLLWLCGLLAFALVSIALLMRKGSTGARRFREGRVTGIVGRKGAGKTLLLTHELLRHVGTRVRCRECQDVHLGHVASNGTLRLPATCEGLAHRVYGWDDLVGVNDYGETYGKLPHGTLVVIDEAHLWAPAIQGKQLPPDVRWLLSQCRKLHIEILWASQHEDRVSLGLRRQTDEVGICERGYFKQMCVKFYEPEDLRKKDTKPAWTYRYRVTQRLAAAYDTYELIAPEASTAATVRAGSM